MIVIEPVATAHLTARVDLEAIRDNLAAVRSLAGDREIMACVKGNAYGHGLVAVARSLESAGARWLTTASLAEAEALLESGIRCRVLLFPTIAGLAAAPLARRGVSIGVQSAEEAAAVARATGGALSIFLKVDCGFGRVGVPLEAAVEAARAVLRLPAVRLDGVFTHLPFGSPESLPWLRERLEAFGDVVGDIRARAPGRVLAQALASTGLACGLDSPGADAVCPGTLLYGLQPAWTGDGPPKVRGLRPALVALTSVIGSLRQIPEGGRFGMGGLRTAERPTRVGVMPIGFSSSILLRKPGQCVAIGGWRAPVLSVSLEHTIVDVTGVSGVDEGSPVHLLARDPAIGPTLDEVAGAQGRAAVEVLVGLTGRATYDYRPQ